MKIKRYEVTFVFQRRVHQEIDTIYDENFAYSQAWEMIEKYPDEELIDDSVEEIDPYE